MPPRYFLFSLCLIVALALEWPIVEVLSWPWRWAGAVPIVLGVALNLAASQAIKKSGTTIKPFEISTALIADGVFAYSRNPIYLGMVLILVGAAMLFGQLSPFLICAAFAALLHFRFILAEERILSETFGDSYRAYCAQTRRWL